MQTGSQVNNMRNDETARRPVTKIWKVGPSGQTLVRTLPGLPYGIEMTAVIGDLGEAKRTGIQKSGTGIEERIIAVDFTLV